MLIFFLVYLGGLLTIFSPCVLPVLPFVFARSDKSFTRNGLPVLIGMAATFTLLATFAAIGGAWLVEINQYGRYAAMLLLLLMGLALVSPSLSERLMRPFVKFGGQLQLEADRQGSMKGSLLLGVAVGFLWAPCAGPILGLVLTGAALKGASPYTALLLMVFAFGAATSLGVALMAGGKVLSILKRGFGAEQWIRRGLGVAVVAGVVFIALGLDTRLLSKLSFFNTTGTEERLISRFKPEPSTISRESSSIPPLTGATLWLNSPPLTARSLQGHVVLIDFWTYSCINCLRTLPYLKAWHEKYRSQGLIVISVHSPEFAFEKDSLNVRRAVSDLGITWPVAMDNDYAIWNAFRNRAWPAEFLFDTQGRIRDQHIGEGRYHETERLVQKLLAEAHGAAPQGNRELVDVKGAGVTAATTEMQRSAETYLGYARQENLASPERLVQDRASDYSSPRELEPDQWGLSGKWLITAEAAISVTIGGSISYRFEGRDLHLVLASPDRKPIRFRVTLDGKAPGTDHGTDIDANGNGVIREQRLYQLIRQRGGNRARTFRIEFLDPGAEAFAFTFG